VSFLSPQHGTSESVRWLVERSTCSALYSRVESGHPRARSVDGGATGPDVLDEFKHLSR
jgi:hypothetical protein